MGLGTGASKKEGFGLMNTALVFEDMVGLVHNSRTPLHSYESPFAHNSGTRAEQPEERLISLQPS